MRHLDSLRPKMIQVRMAVGGSKVPFEELKTEYAVALSEEVNLKQWMNRFKEIALKPVPLSMPQNIIYEEESKVCSDREQIRILKALKEKADYMAKLEKGESHPILTEVKDCIKWRNSRCTSQ